MVQKNFLEAVTSSHSKTKRWRSTFSAARMSYESGDLRQAESLLARAFEMAQELPEKSFAVASTEVGMAAVKLAAGRSREAETRLSKVISTLENHRDDMHKELWAIALRFHAQALANAGDERGAEKELLKSIDILKQLGSEFCVQMAYSLSDLCGLYVTQGRLSEAAQRITSAMNILGTVYDSDNPDYVRADMIYTICTPMEADSRLDIAGESIGKMEYMYGSKHPHIKRALDRYFKILSERGDTAKLDSAKERFCVGSPTKG